MLGWLRLVTAVVVALVTLMVLAPFHLISTAISGKGTSNWTARWHRIVLWVMGVKVTITGTMAADRPLLLLSNHMSWLDIEVLASLAPLSFIAKSEVASWPIFGLLAKLQQSIFIERNRKTKTGEKADEVANRLSGGDVVVLFAEGTSGDGNRVLPFRSALIGAAQKAVAQSGRAIVQPVAIAYVRMHGIPLGRLHRTRVAWYGGSSLIPHLVDVLKNGGVDAHVTFGPPMELTGDMDRKHVAAVSGEFVRRMVAGLNRGADPEDLIATMPAGKSPSDRLEHVS